MSSRRQRFFATYFQHLLAKPRLVLFCGLLLAIISASFAATHLTLNANYDELVSERLDYHHRYMNFLREFGDQEYVYVVVERGDEKTDKAFIAKLTHELQKLPDLEQVISKVDNPALEKNFLLYLDDPQLQSLQVLSGDSAFSLQHIAGWNSFAALFQALREESAKPVSGTQQNTLENGFRFLDGTVDALSRSLSGQSVSFRPTQLFLGDDPNLDVDGFIKSGELYFVLIMPKKDFSTMAVIAKPLAEIRSVLSHVKAEFPGVQVGLTGKPVLAADEIEISNQDNTRETALGFCAVGLMFMFFLRNKKRPALAMLALAIGISWTFGAITLFFGTLNILSMVFSLILIGAGVEYFIHPIARYQEFLHSNPSVDRKVALQWAFQQISVSNLTSSATTAAAFLTMIWTPFLALAQLGFIAALGIMLCLVSSLSILPCLLLVFEGKGQKNAASERRVLTLTFFEKIYHHEKALRFSLIALVLVGSVFALRVSFDNNLLKLQADGLESVSYERKIIEKSSESTWFANVQLASMNDVEKYTQLFAALPSVRKVESLNDLLPADQRAKQQQLLPVQKAFADYQPAPRNFLRGEKLRTQLGQEISAFAGSMANLQAEAFSAGRVDAVETLDALMQKLSALETQVQTASPAQLENLAKFQSNFFAELDQVLLFLKKNSNPPGLVAADLPQVLYQRYVSPKGNYALWIYPKADIWDPAQLQTFVEELRSVHPHVLGTPIEVHESGHLMRETFAVSAVLAFVLMFALVYWDFRCWKPALLAMLSPAVGTLWLVALMDLFGVSFNMANFFSIPILLAVGVDSGVHLVHRMLLDGETRVAATATGTGILLTMIANALGFGTMMLARHKGLASFGVIMTLGSLTYLLAVFLVIPAAARCLLKLPIRKTEKVKEKHDEMVAA